VHIKAGPHRVSAAFVQRFEGPADDLIMPIEHTLADTNIGEVFGTTALTHLRDFTVMGPVAVTGVSETESRRRIFACRPTSAPEESACAADIITRLAGQAYRGPVPQDDLKDLLSFYECGRKDTDFEGGIRLAVQAILASPRFLFRIEQTPSTLRAGQTYRIADADLASRIVWFDAFATHVDRTAKNVNMLVWHKRLWLIDHGATFYMHHDWERALARSADPFERIRDHVLLPRASRIAEVDAELAARLTPEALSQIIANIPGEWLTDAGGEARRADYLTYLTERLKAPRAFAGEAQRAHARL